MDSRATLPARISRSAQEILSPYFCLMGQSRRRDLSMLTLSGQLLRGETLLAPAATTATIRGAIGARGVPGHADELGTVVTEVRRPPLLGICHQFDQVLLERLIVEAREGLGVVEVLAHGIGAGECWCSRSSRNWFGHQSRLVLPTPAVWLKGHLLSSLISGLSLEGIYIADNLVWKHFHRAV